LIAKSSNQTIRLQDDFDVFKACPGRTDRYVDNWSPAIPGTDATHEALKERAHFFGRFWMIARYVIGARKDDYDCWVVSDNQPVSKINRVKEP
jgi:hypothetical protein